MNFHITVSESLFSAHKQLQYKLLLLKRDKHLWRDVVHGISLAICSIDDKLSVKKTNLAIHLRNSMHIVIVGVLALKRAVAYTLLLFRRRRAE